MARSKELLLIRYIGFIVLFCQLFLQNNNKIKSIISIIFILLFIINNNLRIFYFNRCKLRVISIIIELIVIPIAHINLGGAIIFYLIGVSIDIYEFNNKIFRYLFSSIIIIYGIFPSMIENKTERVFNICLIISIFIILSYISKLYNTKVEAQNLYDKLRISEEKLIEANKELEGYVHSIEELTLLKERNRISREIHDSVGHALSTAMIQLSAMERIADKENSSLKEMANNLREFINESFQDVKRAVRELKPNEYENYQSLLTLQEVCNNFEKLSGVKVSTIISKGDWNLSTKQISHLYRITQEVLSNSLRHGKASKINVIMNFTNDEFVLSFSDNGIGTDNIVESGVGLKSIKERTAEINGLVYIKSSLGNGFFIKIVVPKEVEV